MIPGTPVRGSRGDWLAILCYHAERVETEAEAQEIAAKPCWNQFCKTKVHSVEEVRTSKGESFGALRKKAHAEWEQQ